MEEQDRGGSTWEPPQDKSSPDSPWSWVRARAWPAVHCGPRWERWWDRRDLLCPEAHLGLRQSHFSK